MPIADGKCHALSGWPCVCVVVAACVGSCDQTRSFGFDCRLHEPVYESVRAWADARGIASSNPVPSPLRTLFRTARGEQASIPRQSFVLGCELAHSGFRS